MKLSLTCPNQMFSICSLAQMEMTMPTAPDFMRPIENDHADAATAPDVSVPVAPTIYVRIRKLLAIADDPSTNEFESIRARKEGLALVARVLNVDHK
jgi:hypothetical protein